MKYVEAMIQPVGSPNDYDPSAEKLGRAIERMHECAERLADDFADDTNSAPAVPKQLAEYLTQLYERFEEYEHAHEGSRENHDCAENQLLIPVSSNESLETLTLRRGDFLPGDVVAIVKLSDLEALIANQRGEPSGVGVERMMRMMTTPRKHPRPTGPTGPRG